MLSRRDFGKAVAAVTTSALIPANTSYAAFAQAPADPYGVLAREMASRGHRLHHYLWHQSRNNWHRFNDATRAALKKLQWAPPRPSQLADMTILTGNGSGEDFLFMHRGMVREANEILVQAGAAPNQLVNGWARLPEPSDKAFPVPAPYEHLTPAWTEIVRVIKSDEYYEKKLLFWERLYRDPDILRSVSLAELGARMEFTIHDAMHMRWSARPAMGIRPDPTFFDRPPSADELDIDSRWDVVEYNFLGEEYSAQANPIFWKIHGWVDDRISDWM